MEPILFGGTTSRPPGQAGPRDLDKLSVFHFLIALDAWVATVWARENPPPMQASELAEFDRLRLIPEFRTRYPRDWADTERALSVAEIWLNLQFSYRAPVMCLISEPFAEQATHQILHKQIMSPHKLIRLLHTHYSVTQVAARFSCLEYDGVTGHCITLHGVNAYLDAFRFHDSWGDRSLLGKENNHAGVIAVPDPEVPNTWLISPTDLMKVIVGVMVPWPFWSFWQEIAKHDGGQAVEISKQLTTLRHEWIAAKGGPAGAIAAAADGAAPVCVQSPFPPGTAAGLMSHPDPELQYALDVCDTAAFEEVEPGPIAGRSECVFADILGSRGMPVEAARWYERAAGHGDLEALRRLAAAG